MAPFLGGANVSGILILRGVAGICQESCRMDFERRVVLFSASEVCFGRPMYPESVYEGVVLREQRLKVDEI